MGNVERGNTIPLTNEVKGDRDMGVGPPTNTRRRGLAWVTIYARPSVFHRLPFKTQHN